MADWSAEQYLKFEDERTRPARDLLAQIPLADARKVVDIGCGPGNSTELLVKRWPQAAVTGVDTSADMLRQARQRLPGQNFIEANIAHWVPPDSVDVLFANAIFQWVPGHLRQLQRLLGALPPGGVLAVQMPDNLDEPTHVLMREVALSGAVARNAGRCMHELRDHVADAGRLLRCAEPALHTSGDLAHDLQSCARRCRSDRGMGQGNRPAAVPRSAGSAGAQKQYLAEYTARIAATYLPQADGKVLLRFPRIFIVAVR